METRVQRSLFTLVFIAIVLALGLIILALTAYRVVIQQEWSFAMHYIVPILFVLLSMVLYPIYALSVRVSGSDTGLSYDSLLFHKEFQYGSVSKIDLYRNISSKTGQALNVAFYDGERRLVILRGP